jgi:hypothetical protein
MSSPETQQTRKTTKISFRTDDGTLNRLKAVCRVENKTISALIESVLMEHVLCQENPMPPHGEKRMSQRKQCSFPVVISAESDSDMFYGNGMIVNISMNSMQIILKKQPENRFFDHEFHALFTLPGQDHPMLVSCLLLRANCLHEECIIIASFRIGDELEKELLHNYLTTNTFSLNHDKERKHRVS